MSLWLMLIFWESHGVGVLKKGSFELCEETDQFSAESQKANTDLCFSVKKNISPFQR